MAKDENDGPFVVCVKKSGGFIINYDFRHYKDKQITLIFKEKNLLNISFYPWAGPHGATTMNMISQLDLYDYE